MKLWSSNVMARGLSSFLIAWEFCLCLPLPAQIRPPLRLLIADCRNLSPAEIRDFAPLATQILTRELGHIAQCRYVVVSRAIAQNAARQMGLHLTNLTGKSRDRMLLANRLGVDAIVESQVRVHAFGGLRRAVEFQMTLLDVPSGETILGGYQCPIVEVSEVEKGVQGAVASVIDAIEHSPWLQPTMLHQARAKVTLSQGTRDGIQTGDRFLVKRRSGHHHSVVGELRVTHASGSDAEARVIREKQPFQSGDTLVCLSQQRDRMQAPPSPEEAKTSKLVRATTEISIEHTACFGTCPVYKMTIRQDGTVRYVGEDFARRRGTYVGHLRPDFFDRLAEVAEKLGFFLLKDHYRAPVTDQPSVMMSVMRSGKRKTVEDYGDAGPATLWSLERLVDEIYDEVEEWRKVK